MKKQQTTRTAIYRRLSRDDEQSGESMSIENQRILLERYAKETVLMWWRFTRTTAGAAPTLTVPIFSG
ncbi:hypothetical protein ACFOQM_22910 [Paenibacillus sp. GCM10012307]|uniref:Resolvase/invertase-type recombinase catalytic domain-containing protein n=1 Tax=Paenibacillus roseus TaxID=2798579 RepID=A0A934MXD7_9BACL|nr:hypothetical protein [Paenibacillus roseus]MBJ6364077.1 hypothetical protein [Paenibacillus roseus]